MGKSIKILLADDDLNLGPILKAYLEQRGFHTQLVTDGAMAVKAFKEGEFDFCILDVMMPVQDGYEAAKNIRLLSSNVPIMFLSAKNQEADKVKGFECGADDYVTKPFSMEELILRISAILRRYINSSIEDDLFEIGNFVFDYNRQQLIFIDPETEKEDVIKLTSKESDLLNLLCFNMNSVVSRIEALQKIWHNDTYFNARSMDVYITKLRRHLAKDPNIDIINQHGVGFKLAYTKARKKGKS
jgi:DNA-binding response OmpR family regulator